MSINDPDLRHPEDSDDFPARLSSHPPATLPEQWRSDILAAARRALLPPAMSEAPRRGWLTGWMWPHPSAYAVFALVWLLILVLRWSTPGGSTSTLQRFAADASPPDGSVALDRAELAINTVLLASARQQEARP